MRLELLVLASALACLSAVPYWSWDTLELGAAPPASHYSTEGAELAEPEVLSSVDGELNVTLDFDRWTYVGPSGVSVNTRVYAGRLPGPTLRFSRGDTVRVTLQNNLPSTCEIGTSNTIRDFCITNLHTHGLHVSSEAPADNVLIYVMPGETYDYEYAIPSNHLGGTHWYHPHHHGSTALSVLGGSSGMLIVEDSDADGLPQEFRNMPEKVVFMTILHSDLAAAEAMAGGSWALTAPADALLLNGQSKPKLSLAADKWYRLRFALSAVQSRVSLAVPSACEGMLLAKDGVWLPGGARTVTMLHFAPGNRADLALRCPAGTHDLRTVDTSDRRLQGGGGFGGGIQEFPERTIATVEATDQGAVAVSLPTLSLNFPTYLPDLRNAAVDTVLNRIALQGGRGCQFTCGAYSMDTVTEYIGLGKTHEWNVNSPAHPLHVHINHFQLATVTNDPFGGGWHQAGDWMDTFLGGGNVRFLADTFTGDVIAHCHLLIHEDQGCMARFKIIEDASAYSGQTCLAEAGDAPRASGLGGRLLFWSAIGILSSGCFRS